MSPELQAARLAAAGARDGEVDELLHYNESRFDTAPETPEIPLADEPYVASWSRWEEEARREGTVTVLRRYLPQLAFPVAQDVSRSEAYRAAIYQGQRIAAEAGSRLEIERPEDVELRLYASFAGRVPVLYVRHRPDFVRLVQALAKRNEPVPVADGQGAVMISGYMNWSRFRELRRQWEEEAPEGRATATWTEELLRLRQEKELYHDRFIILSDGPYSAVTAAEMELAEGEWRDLSLVIRREHECAHYFTRRVFGSARNHLLDELVADYTGIVAAVGRFRPEWLRRFLGLDGSPRARERGRLELYRGKPPLSEGAFAVLQTVTRSAIETLATFDARWPDGHRSLGDRALAIRVLASLSLLELAAPEAADLLEQAIARCGG